MTKEQKNHLMTWCRHIYIDDMNDDGICEFSIGFKIRDDEKAMKEIFESMTHDDTCDIAAEYVANVYPCEDGTDDWKDSEAEFGVTSFFDSGWGGIRIIGSIRT